MAEYTRQKDRGRGAGTHAKRDSSLKTELKPKKGLPNITVLSTGVTISSKIDYKTGGVYADYTAEDFVAMMPELAEIAKKNIEDVRIRTLINGEEKIR